MNTGNISEMFLLLGKKSKQIQDKQTNKQMQPVTEIICVVCVLFCFVCCGVISPLTGHNLFAVTIINNGIVLKHRVGRLD